MFVGKTGRRRWTEEETSILEESFESYLQRSAGKLPAYKAIRQVQKKNPILASRSEANIKTQVDNLRKRKHALASMKNDNNLLRCEETEEYCRLMLF